MEYEFHHYKDPKLKILFHKDIIQKNRELFPNGHRNPELLLVIQGTLTLYLDGQPRPVYPGQLAIIRSNVLHGCTTGDDVCVYYCLIIDHTLCGDLEQLPEISEDPDIISVYNNIVQEMGQKQHNYKQAVTGLCQTLLALLARQAVQQAIPVPHPSQKVSLVRNATEYIYRHFAEALSLERISMAMNTSKYYLCHVFKEVTGRTVLEMLQYVRCKNAYSMLTSGRHNVAQAAFASGFNNLSYFSKTYKKMMGHSPVEALKKGKHM